MKKITISDEDRKFFDEMNGFLSRHLSSEFHSKAIMQDRFVSFISDDDEIEEECARLLCKTDKDEIIAEILSNQQLTICNALLQYWRNV